MALLTTGFDMLSTHLFNELHQTCTLHSSFTSQTCPSSRPRDIQQRAAQLSLPTMVGARPLLACRHHHPLRCIPEAGS